MELREEDVQSLVQEVLKRLEAKAPQPVQAPGMFFPAVNDAVEASRKSQEVFKSLGLAARKKIIEALRQAALENAEPLAKLAQQETGMGRVEDKIKKNILVSRKTPGVEDLQPAKAYTGDDGLTLVEQAPFGVVAAVTPSTNPTATIINNSISILSAGNSVVFAPHPSAKNCSQETIKILDRAVQSAGGPANLITTFASATQENTVALLKHPKVDMVLVTGGPAIVKIAMTAGIPRKTICAGPGNPPVIVDETAEMAVAASGIVSGASFDNCVLCTGEKEVIVTESAANAFLAELRKDKRAHELSREQMDQLAKIVFKQSGSEMVLNREFVGKNAGVIARAAGLEIPETVKLLWGEVPETHPFLWIEQLMPVLPVTRAADIDKAIALAKEVEGGNHHTASIYSMHVGNITKAAREMACSIFVKNGPNYMGLGMGEGFASMSIGTPTGDGLTKPTHFSRPLHCSMVGYLRIA